MPCGTTPPQSRRAVPDCSTCRTRSPSANSPGRCMRPASRPRRRAPPVHPVAGRPGRRVPRGAAGPGHTEAGRRGPTTPPGPGGRPGREGAIGPRPDTDHDPVAPDPGSSAVAVRRTLHRAGDRARRGHPLGPPWAHRNRDDHAPGRRSVDGAHHGVPPPRRRRRGVRCLSLRRGRPGRGDLHGRIGGRGVVGLRPADPPGRGRRVAGRHVARRRTTPAIVRRHRPDSSHPEGWLTPRPPVEDGLPGPRCTVRRSSRGISAIPLRSSGTCGRVDNGFENVYNCLPSESRDAAPGWRTDRSGDDR